MVQENKAKIDIMISNLCEFTKFLGDLLEMKIQ